MDDRPTRYQEKSVEDKELLGLFHKEHREAQSSTKVLGDLRLQGLPQETLKIFHDLCVVLFISSTPLSKTESNCHALPLQYPDQNIHAWPAKRVYSVNLQCYPDQKGFARCRILRPDPCPVLCGWRCPPAGRCGPYDQLRNSKSRPYLLAERSLISNPVPTSRRQKHLR